MVGRCLEAAYRLSLLPSLPSLKKLSARFAENEGTTSCRARHSASVLPTGRQLPLLSREDLRQQPLPLKRKTKSSRQGWITGAPTAKSSATTLRKIARTLTTCSKTYCGDDFFLGFCLISRIPVHSRFHHLHAFTFGFYSAIPFIDTHAHRRGSFRCIFMYMLNVTYYSYALMFSGYGHGAVHFCGLTARLLLLPPKPPLLHVPSAQRSP